jgi:SAM-dependent methyltransferase
MVRIPEGATVGVHESVRAILDRVPRGTLLDAPCGPGAIAQYAADAGFSVTACDIDPDQSEVACEKVDLNGPLPYADGRFDVVTCIEAIEHLENQFGLLRELHRVLRPSGMVVLTTPNVSSVTARLRYLGTGLLPFFDFDWTLREWGHITPITIPELAVALERAGFTITSVTGNRVTTRARVLAALLGPPIRFVTRRTVRDESLRRLLSSRTVLSAEILVVEAAVVPAPD